MKLYSIRVPQNLEEDGRSDIKAEINLSEQLFAALSQLKHPVVLEMAVQHIGEEIQFYAAVHESESQAVAKQIQGIWPEAQVEPVSDYNPFNKDGVNLAAYLLQREHFALPLRTYAEIDGDTFGPIVSAFSKLNEIGEGASIQVILRPASVKTKKSIVKLVQSLKRGEPLAETLRTSVVPTMKGIKEAMWTDEKKQEKKEREKVVDEDGVKALEAKAAKPLFRANVRLVASGPDVLQAETVLNGILTGFSQFRAPFRNEFKLVRPKKSEKLIFQYSFREFDESQAMILNSEEIASFFHLPISATNIPRIKWLKAREATPPANLPTEGAFVGVASFRGDERPVFMLPDDRRRHMYLIGQTGTGKSTIIYNMALGDIEAGAGVCVMDPNGDLIQNILASIPDHRLDDVILFDPTDIARPMGMNMLEFDKSRPEQKTFIVNEIQSIFNRLFPPETMGPMFEQYMRNALLLLMEDADNEPGTLMEVPRIFTDESYRDRRLSRINNPAVVDFWRNEAIKAGGDASLANMAPYITSKFNNFVANDYIRPIIAQAKSAFNFREVMDSGKILLVNLSKGRLGDINAGLLGMVIVGKLQMAAFSRADTLDQEKRRDFFLYIDEFQNFTTDSIATIFSEARKYRLNLIVAHQFIGQLTEKIRDAVFGNAGTIVSFRIGAPDAEFLIKQFAPTFTENDLINIDNLNAYIKLLIRGETAKPFNIRIPINYRTDVARGERLRELNRQRYGKPREEIEMDVYARLRN